MLKLLAVTAIGAGALLAPVDAIAKSHRSATSAVCPPGTCAMNGGATAKELRHCSAKNCRGAANQKKK